MIEGVKMLAFTHYMQGPSAAQTLADLGADVIKIESPQGPYERNWSGCNTYINGASVFFMLANRNQKSLILNLKDPDAIQAVYDLVKEYDVVLENFKPGVMNRLGRGYEKLKEINPRLIYCSCSGYGSKGPKVNVPGQDMLAQGVSGLAQLSGAGDRPPAPVGTPAVDQHGAILAALGTLAAIYRREKTGQGCKVDSCLLNAALDLQLEPLAYFMNGGVLTDRPATGLSSRFHQSPYGVYATKDDCITLSLTHVDKLKPLFTPGCLDGYTFKDQMDKRLEVDKIICAEMKKKTTAEWMKVFEEHGIWHGPCNYYPEVLADEQVKFNKVVLEIKDPDIGTVKVVNHPVRYDDEPPPLRLNPPKHGEHSAEVLKSIGYDDARIAKLIEKGVTKQYK